MKRTGSGHAHPHFVIGDRVLHEILRKRVVRLLQASHREATGALALDGEQVVRKATAGMAKGHAQFAILHSGACHE